MESRKIELLPFGGVAEVEEQKWKSTTEEKRICGDYRKVHYSMFDLIALSYLLLPLDFWTSTDHKMFITHNVAILLFNVLPIWPLDGGKLMYLFFLKSFHFNKVF
ncbi:hypothetical protein KHA80_17160 [Anaerobacillus sp. HL2]|nr:hypothetical protein KHA80_17160 [Anaerobacillus sp. HL2]